MNVSNGSGEIDNEIRFIILLIAAGNYRNSAAQVRRLLNSYKIRGASPTNGYT